MPELYVFMRATEPAKHVTTATLKDAMRIIPRKPLSLSEVQDIICRNSSIVTLFRIPGHATVSILDGATIVSFSWTTRTMS
jgi:hypothetical protein